MKYFAYGSNMLTRRLRDPRRAPSAAPLGLGFLPHYELRFQKASSDESSKCTVVPSVGCQVFGVIFEIARDEKHRLDKAEGLGQGYSEDTLKVIHGHRPLSVIAYIAQPNYIIPGLAPYTWYRDLVVAGAREHGLSEEYIEFLLATAATEDPDRQRDSLNRRLLAANPATA